MTAAPPLEGSPGAAAPCMIGAWHVRASVRQAERLLDKQPEHALSHNGHSAVTGQTLPKAIGRRAREKRRRGGAGNGTQHQSSIPQADTGHFYFGPDCDISILAGHRVMRAGCRAKVEVSGTRQDRNVRFGSGLATVVVTPSEDQNGDTAGDVS